MALEIFKLVGSVFVDTDKADKSLKKTDKQASSLGKSIGAGVKAVGKFALGVGKAAVAAGGALVALTESTREYRTEQGKLESAFKVAGFEGDEARKTYEELNGVLGDSGQAVEAANHLAQLCTTAGELADWTTICTGVYATFGDSLPIEGLTEAANETVKTGVVTGSLADALNWAGVSEDDFNESLAACTTEQERQALITETLNGLYGEAAEAYKEANAEVIAANKAQDNLNNALAKIGKAFEPAVTDVKNLGAALLNKFVPGVEAAADALVSLLGGDEGAAENLGTALSDILATALDLLVEMVPGVVEVALSLISTFATTILEELPSIARTFAQLLATVIIQLSETLPDLMTTIVDSLLGVLNNLLAYAPDVIAAFVALFTAVVAELPAIIELIVAWIPELIRALIDAILVALPVILEGIVSVITALIESLPVLIPQLVEMISSIIEMIVEALPELIPQIIEALITLIEVIVEMLPVIIPMVIQAVVSIVTAIIEALPDILTALCEALPELLTAVWDAIVTIFEELPTWFEELWQGAVDLIEEVFEPLVEWFEDIWDDICEVFDPVAEWFEETFDDAYDNVESAFEDVGDFFSDVYDSVTGAFENITDWFSETFSDAWSAVKKVFSTGGAIFKGIKEGIAGVFTKTVNSIITGLNTVIAKPFKTINSILDTIRDVEILGFTPFSGIGSLTVPSIPKIKELEEGAVLEKGQRGFLEGNGAEAIVPLHKNQEWISAVARDMDSALGATTGDRVADVLADILAALEELVGAGIYLDTGALVGALARPMDRKLGQIQAAKGRA